MAETGKAKASKSKTGVAKKKAIAAKAVKTSAREKGIVPVTSEFVNDLKSVFAKHKWPGHTVGFVAHPSLAALDVEPCDPGPSTCPDGSTPSQQWARCPDGTLILRNFCP